MNDLIVKQFKNDIFYNFVWNNKPCWIAVEVADLFGYAQKSRPISNCIRREKFEIGVEYDVLEGEDLKLFKEVFVDEVSQYKYVPKIFVFYEEGLYGFLAYTEMPLGIEFRNWIRREVMPALREKGYYVSNEEKMQVNYKKETSKDMLRKTTTNNTGDKLDKLKAAYDSAMMFKELLDDMTLDSTYKFLLIKQIYLDAGINLPKYIEEEKI